MGGGGGEKDEISGIAAGLYGVLQRHQVYNLLHERWN